MSDRNGKSSMEFVSNRIQNKNRWGSRRRRRLRRHIVIVLLFVVFCIFAMDVRLQTTIYNIDAKEIRGEVRIALIADLHSCDYGIRQKTLVNALNEHDPDIVLLGGDFFDDDLPYNKSIELLEELYLKYPMYYVTGNHEYWSDTTSEMLDILENFGVTILNGKKEVIDIRGEKINIGGVDDPDGFRSSRSEISMKEQLKKLSNIKENGYYSILLSHRPEYHREYEKYRFDLVLSGHTHGGQWRIPFLVNGLFAPDQGLFPKYAGGMYELKEMKMIVSRGLARESTMIPRIFNRPELVMLYLR